MSKIISYNIDIHPDVYDASIDIIEKIGIERALCQLAEECSELSQASLKLARNIDGKNSTNKTDSECWSNWIEEVADVLVSLVVTSDDLNLPEFENMFQKKLFRWVDRLNGKSINREE